ncbi:MULTISPECIES: hypothetical protein [unclassified Frankia]|uniref:hypothetical protein n=1 Tax=unclassified Frankia TaxID=2632575 RepID=UPI001EF457DE|nr:MULTISPECIES: hypothetical protein [unclassified Frankia]
MSISALPDPLVRALGDLASLLSVDISVSDLTDEHQRFALYSQVVASDHLNISLFAVLCAALRVDPDRVMASGTAGLLLTVDAPDHVIDAIREVVGDSVFVNCRIREIEIFRQLADGNVSVHALAGLDGASGWLEEALANRSESLEVLEYLAKKATRRVARRIAGDRLRLLRAQAN